MAVTGTLVLLSSQCDKSVTIIAKSLDKNRCSYLICEMATGRLYVG